MSKAKPGPAPRSFGKFIRSVSRGGVVAKCRMQTAAGEKTVKWQGAPKTEGIINKMDPDVVEFLDEDGEILGVWEFQQPEETAAPGYAKEEGDTDDERLLKTFAHLLADAHKSALAKVTEVVTLQAQSFAEERRHLATTIQTAERINQKLRRVRVATDDDTPSQEGGGDDDSFLMNFIGPIVQAKVAEAVRAGVGGAAATPAASTNGAAAKGKG